MTAVGLAGVTYGVTSVHQPFAMLPGMDGALTMGVLGFVFALLHGLRYRSVLQMLIPVLGIQIGGCLAHGESVVAVVGLELTFVGAVGVAMAAVLSHISHDALSGRRGPEPRRATAAGMATRHAMMIPDSPAPFAVEEGGGRRSCRRDLGR